MIDKKTFKIGNRSISVYDGFFSFQENLEIYQVICQQSFTRSNLDNNFQNNKDIDIKWSCLLKESNMISKILDRAYYDLDELKDRRIEIFRQYINFATSETVDQIHVDSPAGSINSYTILHYVNFMWDKNWHGETVFYNSAADEIEVSTMIKPGRIVVFDSNIPHAARPPSKIAEYGRYTIATKMLIL